MTLVLQAVDVRGPSRWRWLLTDDVTGNPLADHQVVLDADEPRMRAFGNVFGHVSSYAAQDRWAEDEARLVAELGAWAGTTLLGERICERIVKAAPVTVRVTADFAVGWPLAGADIPVRLPPPRLRRHPGRGRAPRQARHGGDDPEGRACSWARDGGLRLRGQLAEQALYLSSRYCTNRPHSPVMPSWVTELYPRSGRGRSASS